MSFYKWLRDKRLTEAFNPHAPRRPRQATTKKGSSGRVDAIAADPVPPDEFSKIVEDLVHLWDGFWDSIGSIEINRDSEVLSILRKVRPRINPTQTWSAYVSKFQETIDECEKWLATAGGKGGPYAVDIFSKLRFLIQVFSMFCEMSDAAHLMEAASSDTEALKKKYEVIQSERLF